MIKRIITPRFALVITILSMLLLENLKAQESITPIIDKFQAYSELPREIAHAHLNKNTLLKGESLGFQVYVMDKGSKQASENTTNVYFSIETETGNIIKSGLLLSKNGVSNGVVDIDSTFVTGNYLFKTYTNWMKNFSEQNFYLQNIKIINEEDGSSFPEKTVEDYKLDAQFLPEGGHLVSDIENIVGVVVKDNTGKGVSGLGGKVYDENDNEVSSFSTNKFGISKFPLIPKIGASYRVKFGNNDKTIFSIGPAEIEGINLKLTDLGKRVALSIRANDRTMEKIKDKTFKLSVHNGDSIKAIDFSFSEGAQVNKLFNYGDIYPGMNVFTVFDQDNQPLLERLFFRHEGIPTVKLNEPKISKKQDSIEIRFYTNRVKEIDSSFNVSISVLPENTVSYAPHQSIVSKLYLQPYVNGFIEEAGYYFKDVDARKRYELDMLLLIQGWSSYSWTTVFSNPPKINFEFENGISVTANGTDPSAGQYMIYPMENSGTVLLDAKQESQSFTIKGLLPFGDEEFSVGFVNKREKVKKPSLTYRFSPSGIPSIENYIKTYPFREEIEYGGSEAQPILLDAYSDTKVLDEVVITAKKEEERMEKLTKKFRGRVDVFDSRERLSYVNFASYLSVKGFTVFQNQSDLIVTNPRPSTINASRTPLVYLDGQLLPDFNIFLNFDMRTVDYIVIDKSGLTEGMRGGAGVIRVYTDPSKQFDNLKNKPVAQNVNFPLTFSKPKRFYVPKYTYYKSEFFKKYGVIDWKPNLRINESGFVEFMIPDTGNDRIKFFIEGFAGDGKFISEEKDIIVN